jgi:rhamnose utilization protein RhaD (predicted bifunctional aldolase and dehydrogenase)
VVEFDALRTLSAQVGADPLLVQGPGGNTSVKDGDVMWIKASGTWLRDALTSDIFVPLDHSTLLAALSRNDPACETSMEFLRRDLNAAGLRPSIETTLHAVMPQRVVVHVHCVKTIAVAVRRNLEDILAERLEGLNWCHVPYFRPGLPLSRGMMDRMSPATDVVILGNHGLVVAAGSVGEAGALLRMVSVRLAAPAREVPPPDLEKLAELAHGSSYRLPRMPKAHGVATDPENLHFARSGSLYPDHVIFLGPGSVVVDDARPVTAVERDYGAAGLPAPVSLLYPGLGLLVRQDASAGAEALARCLADVTSRIPAGAAVNTLTDADNAALLNWDAEKYRQQLNLSARKG